LEKRDFFGQNERYIKRSKRKEKSVEKEGRGVLPAYYYIKVEGQEGIHIVELFFIGL
jgi:hypothetical protein